MRKIMWIEDIRLSDVKAGKSWRFASNWDCEIPMEEWGPIEEATVFDDEDHVVYSALHVASGRVTPLVLIKEVQHLDYGGDYCEFVDGAWR